MGRLQGMWSPMPGMPTVGSLFDGCRYTEAMAVLQDQASNEYPDSENSGKRVCVRCASCSSSYRVMSCCRKRDMFLLKCDDVVSPPLWVFPLIHSTTYLKNLAMVSKEAQEVGTNGGYKKYYIAGRFIRTTGV